LTRARFRIRSVGATLAAILSVAASATAASPSLIRRGVDVKTTVSAGDSITVGERFQVRHTFVFPDSLDILIPREIDPGNCRVLSLDWSQKRSDNLVEETADLTLITLDLKEARLPELAVEFHSPSGDTLIAFSDEVVIPVRQLAPEGDTARPLKEQWIAPRSYWKWVAAAAALLLLAAALVWWLRVRSRRVEEAPPEPRLPADYVALSELSRIERMNLLEGGEFKTYYTLVTDAVRRYLEDRFGVEAMERTTMELLDELEANGRRMNELEELLFEADLVKFAKFVPGVDAAKTAMASAREIIVKTADRVEVA
jgi:hypothetical protein